VPQPTVTPTPDPVALIGHPVKGDSGTVYRLMADQTLRPIADWGAFLALGYLPGDIVTLPQAEIDKLKIGEAFTRLINFESQPDAYFLLHNGARYALTATQTQAILKLKLLVASTLPDALKDNFPVGTQRLPYPALFPSDGDLGVPEWVIATTRTQWQPAERDYAPRTDYINYLKAFPRPADDNGRCLHYLQSPSGDAFEVRQEIARLHQLGVRWVLVNYVGSGMLKVLAPLFAESGIMVVWRPFLRPTQEYKEWAADIDYLKSLGVPPYMQLYNEASLGQEWNEGKPDQTQYLKNLLPAIREVYLAGGYIGLQEIDPEWLRADLQQIKNASMTGVLPRLFFIPHAYGFNHPPSYVRDEHGVLGFRHFAAVFEQELGFVPMMIAGEGGWRPGEAQDERYPAISAAIHRDYHVAVYDWFRFGQLSDGAPLPDYLFAFCPWLLADRTDPAAWFDAQSGDLLDTVKAVEAIPPFTRRFSWER
jgi:hypothetical protein